MSITISLDYHQRTSSYCLRDDSGNMIKRSTIDNNKYTVKNLLSSYKEPIR
jgi:hypothetical protein